jgi:hypothetical protein
MIYCNSRACTPIFVLYCNFGSSLVYKMRQELCSLYQTLVLRLCSPGDSADAKFQQRDSKITHKFEYICHETSLSNTLKHKNKINKMLTDQYTYNLKSKNRLIIVVFFMCKALLGHQFTNQSIKYNHTSTNPQ